MSTFEELFNTSTLDVIVPVASVGFPTQDQEADADASSAWLNKLDAESIDRKTAFFDENLDFILTLRFDSNDTDTSSTATETETGDDDPSGSSEDITNVTLSAGGSQSNEPDSSKPPKPPLSLLSFLSHLQISYEAAYISSLPAPSVFSPEAGVPPRTLSIAKSKAASLLPTHPSIFPPSTPHPLPATGQADRQYVQSQGTLLRSGVWGERGIDGSTAEEKFALVWSKRDQVWVAVYKMMIQVAFMATKEDDPLLCLTVSTTLRPKPLTMTPAREPLAVLLEAAGGLSTTVDPTTPTNVNGEDDEDDEGIDVIGLEEVNLLENLSLGPSFAGTLSLPSLRLGPTVRKNVFSLPPVSAPDTPQSAATTITRSAHPTLRKSFRKTLQTVSGFRVRMRTVFVPYFMPSQDEIPSKPKSSKHVTRKVAVEERDVGEGESDSDSDSDDPDVIHARELREAGNEEHTVILCVEVENTGESMSYFSVESINVNVGGEGASTRLITWGDPAAPASRAKSSEKMFPLYLGPREQYNMLYAVSFLKNPEADEFSLARGKGLPGRPVVQELQRAVAIIINGRPFDIKSQVLHPSHASSSHLQPILYKRRSGGSSAESLPPLHGLTNNPDDFIYPTHTFPSRWNCVLDLSAQPNHRSTTSGQIGTGSMEGPDAETMINDALPTPASPFPPSVLRSSFPSARTTSPRPISVQSTMGAVGMVGSPGGRSSGARSGTPTPQGGGGPASVAGSKKHSLSAMDAAERSSSAASTPRGLLSPVNYKSKTSMLNPANQRDPHMQSGSQLQIQQQQSQSHFQSFAALAGGGGSSGSSSLSPSAASNPAASGSSSLNPILGSLNTGMGQFQRTSNAYIPPSVTFSQYAKSPTTYGPISPPLPPVPSTQSGFNVGMPSNRGGGHHGLGHAYDDSISSEISVDGYTNTFTIFPSGAAGIGSGLGLGGGGSPPPTPAYPAYPSSPAFPPTPNWQGPINYSSQSGSGPSVEIKRDKASSGSSMGIIGGGLGTPGPRISTGGPFASLPPFGGASVSVGGVSGMGKGEPIVVSVGLLPLIRRSKVERCRSSKGGDGSASVGEKDGNGKGVRGEVDGDERIYPLDQFTLDIFVFNQSSWTRRFEVSYPDRRKLRKGKALLSSLLPHPRSQGSRPTSFVTGGASKSGDDDLSAGVLPLENRVRIGPLLPSTCQSVRVDFLALKPGVHSIDTLTLTDIQSGYTMNLRHVIDVVVHEHEVHD